MGDLEARKERIASALGEIGQGHVLRWWPELTVDRRAAFLDQLDAIDWDGFARRTELLRHESADEKFSEKLRTAPCVSLPVNEAEREQYLAARRRGEELIAAGRIGALMVAGGQGSRLGYNHPKGMYQIGPVTERSLFQIHAEKLLVRGRRAGVAIPWCIMTSSATHDETVAHFEERNYYGMDPADVRFFGQEMIPAVDRQRRLMLADKDRVFVNPNGHGGTLKALYDEGVLDWLAERGVTDAYYFQVDNCGLDVADPAFIGNHDIAGSEMSSKALRKTHAGEGLGVFGLVGDDVRVIEYSDLDARLADERDGDGELRYWMGSPAVHVLNLAFVRRLNEGGFKLPWHLAQKSISCIDEQGERVDDEEKNGVKFETFIFDALSFAANPLIFEMSRAEEWAPLKRPEGEESPATVRAFLHNLYADQLREAGVPLPEDYAGRIEISPLFALDAEDIKAGLDPADIDLSGDILIGVDGIVR